MRVVVPTANFIKPLGPNQMFANIYTNRDPPPAFLFRVPKSFWTPLLDIRLNFAYGLRKWFSQPSLYLDGKQLNFVQQCSSVYICSPSKFNYHENSYTGIQGVNWKYSNSLKWTFLENRANYQKTTISPGYWERIWWSPVLHESNVAKSWVDTKAREIKIFL